ncbi:MAG TPA: phosphodiester glycosidase family protein [bacterium]|nr:phosphodiester glycosidase family protein [bacterium]
MKKIKYLIIFSLFFLLSPVFEIQAESLSGRILLDVERNGEAWYIYPEDNKRYYLGRPSDAFKVMRELGLGITEYDFQQIAQAGMPIYGNLELTEKLAGRIVLQVERNGEAWYINPVDLKKYYLGRPDDAFKIMRELGLGISRKDLAVIHKNTFSESLNDYSSYQYKKKITVNGVDFFIDLITIDLNNPNLKIITDTANSEDCLSKCEAKPLIDYVILNNAFSAINASYFDTSALKLNYYFFPVYNSRLQTFINSSQLKYPTTGPLMAFDTNNKFYYFKDSRDFKSVSNFENVYGVKLQATIGNKPRLIENKQNLLIDWEVDEGQLKTKTLRNAIAYKSDNNGKGIIYLVVARQATVIDLAEILKTMEVDYAINLDGGYSSALYYNDEYMVGPGRNIPNAILFSEG